jgi:hypothetical protein
MLARVQSIKCDSFLHLTLSCDSIKYHTMQTTTVRELRGSFPKVKKLIETEGSVIVSDYGEPKYLITLYTPPPKGKPPAKDYLARLKRFQPRPMSSASSAALREENRGDR